MPQKTEGETAASAPAVLQSAAEALTHAVGWMTEAGRRIEAAHGDPDAVELLAEEARDVLVRVKGEREKLLSALPKG